MTTRRSIPAIAIIAVLPAVLASMALAAQDRFALFAQSLHHRVVVHEHDGVVLADRRDCLDQQRRQVEVLAFPVAPQVLRAALDRAVVVDLAGAAEG